MAERRNARILKFPFVLAFLLTLFSSGCQPTLAALPHKIQIEENATITPASTATPVEPPVSPAQSTTTTPQATAPETNPQVYQSVPTISERAPDTATATAAPFATLDDAWPTPPMPLPPPAIPFAKPEHVVNILLLGNDVPWAQGGRTDSMNIVSLNRKTGKMTLLSIPRDLYVVIPGWMMTRINLAHPHGHGTDYPGGGGALVKDTILYNLGIPIDYYVRIGFSGFKEIVDNLGGVEIVVNCPIEDWRLRAPDLDPESEQNWEPFLLEPGLQQMDGEMALWYARSRRSSNDIDRGRRQQKMIRALMRQARSGEILTRLPALWEGFAEMFETDMTLGDVLELATLAPEMGEIEHFLLAGDALRPWKVPGSGAAVQLLNREAATPVLRQSMHHQALNDVSRSVIPVEVVTNDPIMYRQVADNLLWYGFEPSFIFRETADPSITTIFYGGSNAKGAFANQLTSIFRQDVNDIIFLADGEVNKAHYQVSLGKGHNPCLPYLENGWYE